MRKLVIAGMMTAALIGCGDDEPTEPTTDAGTMDAMEVTYEVQVDKPGAKCATDGDCKGKGPTCLTTIDLSGLASFLPDAPSEITFEGGYCTAACTDSAECSDGGDCMLADLPEEATGLLATVLPDLMPFCAQKCDTKDDCRADHDCLSMADLFMNVEVPDITPEGGAGDGGAADGGDADGGDADGGEADAAAADAGTGGGGFNPAAILGGLLPTDTYCFPPPPEAPAE